MKPALAGTLEMVLVVTTLVPKKSHPNYVGHLETE